MKKRKIFGLLIFFALIALTACGKKKEEPKKEDIPETINYLVLVNKENKLPDNWESLLELADATDAWGDGVKVEKVALRHFYDLKRELEQEGIYIELDSAYRSVAEQDDLWARWSEDPEKGPEYVEKYVAKPGYSEHHTGLAIDICLKKKGKIIADNDAMIKEKAIFSKVHARLANNGFILRYPEGKENITGYSYEPWHLRYIGRVDIAREIMENGITLEEYLKSHKDS